MGMKAFNDFTHVQIEKVLKDEIKVIRDRPNGSKPEQQAENVAQTYDNSTLTEYGGDSDSSTIRNYQTSAKSATSTIKPTQLVVIPLSIACDVAPETCLGQLIQSRRNYGMVVHPNHPMLEALQQEPFPRESFNVPYTYTQPATFHVEPSPLYKFPIDVADEEVDDILRFMQVVQIRLGRNITHNVWLSGDVNNPSISARSAHLEEVLDRGIDGSVPLYTPCDWLKWVGFVPLCPRSSPTPELTSVVDWEYIHTIGMHPHHPVYLPNRLEDGLDSSVVYLSNHEKVGENVRVSRRVYRVVGVAPPSSSFLVEDVPVYCSVPYIGSSIQFHDRTVVKSEAMVDESANLFISPIPLPTCQSCSPEVSD